VKSTLFVCTAGNCRTMLLFGKLAEPIYILPGVQSTNHDTT